MSMLFNILAAQKSHFDPLLAYYPLLDNLNDTKGGTPATFERASRKLTYNDTTNLMQWHDEDIPAFNNGIWLESEETGKVIQSNNITVSPWVNDRPTITTITGTVLNVETPTGEIDDCTGFFGNSDCGRRQNGISFGANFKYTAHYFIKADIVVGTLVALATQQNSEGGSQGRARVTYQLDNENVTVEPASNPRNYQDYRIVELSNGWYWLQLDFGYSTTANRDVRFIASASPNLYPTWGLCCVDIGSSLIISGASPATRAADKLITNFDGSGDDYCMYAEIAAMPRWDTFATPKFCMFRDNDSAGFGAAILCHSSGQAIIRIYYGSSGQYDVPTGYHYDVALSAGVKLIIRFRKVTSTVYSQIKVDFSLNVAPEWFTYSSWSANIHSSYLQFDALRWDSGVGIIQADDYSTVLRGRHIKQIKKIAGVDHTPAVIEAMT